MVYPADSLTNDELNDISQSLVSQRLSSCHLIILIKQRTNLLDSVIIPVFTLDVDFYCCSLCMAIEVETVKNMPSILKRRCGQT